MHTSASDVARRVPPSVAVVTADGERRCLVTTGADDLGMLVGHLAALPWDLDVLEPPELRYAVRSAAARLARAAGDNRSGTPAARG